MESDIGTIGTWVAFALTLMAYCYMGKEIPALRAIYRVAAYVFIGVALGYGAVMAWHSILVSRFLLPLQSGRWWYLVPLALCLLLLVRVRRSWSGLGNVTLAFLFGVGSALAVGGGVVGTLIPQVQATFVSLNPAHYEGIASREGSLPIIYALNAFLVALGTITSLLYFYFTTGSGSQRSARLPARLVRLSAGLGKVFIMFTFGALFATTAISRVSLLVDRIRFIIDTLWSLVSA